MQLLSGSADGLIRLWTIRSGECEATFDRHANRIWAIAASDNVCMDDMFLSGGSDSQIYLWRDVTVEEENKKLEKVEEMLVMEQGLMNDMRGKRYGKVIFFTHVYIYG